MDEYLFKSSCPIGPCENTPNTMVRAIVPKMATTGEEDPPPSTSLLVRVLEVAEAESLSLSIVIGP
jgi:hypothetical protein